ncbi:hypothetical protein LCGC14_0742160 [marine sediment metagenome]|uniref:Soluble ligand binding domain-containing protein n=1 Tax=marine sediment metagenome TaxID=412755 RepID=A0A0F9TDG7_9ZZZZ|nr:hypothetical protein [Candidatus Aminicenantes bacterium]HEB36052.1 hypothetical protein [Candidatus Aminicenantes bacterium]
MGKRTFFVTLLIFLVTGFIYSQEILQENQAREYHIGAKDLLEISVFGLDEMSQTVRVSEKGKITLPLLGEIEVEEMTKAELERKLGQLLEKKYLQNPQVTVFIREYQSKKVYILGAVGKPGSYKLLGRQTVLQLISDAGGLVEDAGDEIIVIRQRKDGPSKTLRILIDDLILKGDARLNIPLEPNDIVNIPVDKTVFIYVFGQVRRPGALNVKKLNIPTLLQVIAQAGGFSERASKRRVLIKRIDKDGKEQEIKVNVKDIIKGKKKDIQLKENDVVYVPETIF